MKTFKELRQELNESKKLSKIQRELSSGGQIGTVSPETAETNTKKTKKAAHKKIQSDLKRLSKSGAISFTGPHKGRYKYSGTEEPAAEGSYILRPGKHPSARRKFKDVLDAIGKRYNQQSVLSVDKGGKGVLRYASGEKEDMGNIHYNQPLKTGSGDTAIKSSRDKTKKEFTKSFTVQKE